MFVHICVCTCACVCGCACKFCNQGSSWEILADSRQSFVCTGVDSSCVWSEEIVDLSRWLYWPSQCTTAVVELHLTLRQLSQLFWIQFLGAWCISSFKSVYVWTLFWFNCGLQQHSHVRVIFCWRGNIHLWYACLNIEFTQIIFRYCSDSLLIEHWDAIFGEDCTQCPLLWKR